MEQIVAGALILNFENISNFDITVFLEDLKKYNPDYEIDEKIPGYIHKYLKLENERISLRDDLTLNSHIEENHSTLKETLEQIAGPIIRDYIQKFNLENFMLRKIKNIGSFSEDSINRNFCKKEQNELINLNNQGYLTTIWNDDIPSENYREIKLSRYGNLKFFKIEYKEELEKFIDTLNSLKYDTSIIDDFLLTQDLDLPVWSILTIEKLEEFCHTYDRALFVQCSSSKKYV